MTAEWHYSKNGLQHGPVSASDLKNLAKSGELLWKMRLRRLESEAIRDCNHAARSDSLRQLLAGVGSSRMIRPEASTAADSSSWSVHPVLPMCG